MGLRICMLAHTALVLSILIKQWKSDFLPFVRLAIALFFSVMIISAASPLILYLETLMESASIAEHATLLLKALGVATLTQICSEICKECGENGLASGIEIVGKIEILLLSLPLINQILSLAKEMMSLGG